jgi:hypothetical protein
VWVVAELPQYPCGQDRAEAGLTGVALSVRGGQLLRGSAGIARRRRSARPAAAAYSLGRLGMQCADNAAVLGVIMSFRQR